MTNMHRLQLILQLAPIIYMSSVTPDSCRVVSSHSTNNHETFKTDRFMERKEDSFYLHVQRRNTFRSHGMNIADSQEQKYSRFKRSSKVLCLRGGSGGSDSPRFASPELPHSFDLQHLTNKPGTIDRRGTKRPIPETTSELDDAQEFSTDPAWSSRWALDSTTRGCQPDACTLRNCQF